MKLNVRYVMQILKNIITCSSIVLLRGPYGHAGYKSGNCIGFFLQICETLLINGASKVLFF